MRLVRLFAALVAALAFGGLAVAGTASAATTVEDCQAQLATLSADTLAARDVVHQRGTPSPA